MAAIQELWNCRTGTKQNLYEQRHAYQLGNLHSSKFFTVVTKTKWQSVVIPVLYTHKINKKENEATKSL